MCIRDRYQYSNNTWTQLGGDIDGEASNDWSGRSVSLSSDGTIVAIGATGNDGNASVGLFVNGGGVATAYYHNEYYDGYNVSVLRNMAAGDYVELKVANSTGGNLPIGQPDAGDTVFMWGYRLG